MSNLFTPFEKRVSINYFNCVAISSLITSSEHVIANNDFENLMEKYVI